MTLAEKVGEMTQADRSMFTGQSTSSNNSLNDLRAWLLGSTLSGAGDAPTPNTPTGWADMVDSFQYQALATPLQIPLIYGEDSVHGDGNMIGATVFPHNIGMGATRDPAPGPPGGRGGRGRDPRHRSAVGLRSVSLRGPRRPLGPHL